MIAVGICHYPGALKSAVYGLEEMFHIANRFCAEHAREVVFHPVILKETTPVDQDFSVVILPPAIQTDDNFVPDTERTEWLRQYHHRGTVIASACAGTFILAATGLAGHRPVTTHWGLAERFREHFPDVTLDSNAILINHGDIITAGGMMSWVDLGLELVAQYSGVGVMRKLGKLLVVDTAPREQRFYQQFSPSFSHGDAVIVQIQHQMHADYGQPLLIQAIAQQASLTVRTMQRRFVKATGYSPNQYLQRLRVQKACELLENSNHAFEYIAHQVGYEDISACRKVFIKVMGLTPKAFRMRFAGETERV